MTQLAITMRGALATIFEKTHCYTCHSKLATGVCVECGVATYCDAQCAQVGWSDHGHAVTCGSYSRLISTVTMASLRAPLGWPMYLESKQERDGFAYFVKKRVFDLDINHVYEAPPMRNVDALLQVMFAALIYQIRDAMKRVLKTFKDQHHGDEAKRYHDYVFNMFKQNRRDSVTKDLMELRPYPDDTLLKQIWRNLKPEERQNFIDNVQKKKAATSKEEEDDEEEREQKHRSLAIDTVNNYLSDHHDGLPTELIMAIINHLSPKDIMATVLVDKRLNEIVWEIMYMIDIVPLMNKTPEIKALFASLSTKSVDFKKRYMAVGRILSEGMATAVIGDMTDANADDDAAPTMRFFLVNDGPYNSTPIFEGRTMPRFFMPLNELEEKYVGVNVDQFDVRYVERFHWYEYMIPDDIKGEERLEAARNIMASALKINTKWHARRNVSFLFSQQQSDSVFSKYYGHPYWSNGIAFNASVPSLRNESLEHPYAILDKATRTHRFGWDEKAVNRTTAVLHEALETFFFDLFMRGHTDMTLTVGYAEFVGTPYVDDFAILSGTEPENDDKWSRNRLVRQTIVSLLTGAREVDVSIVNALETEKFENLFYPNYFTGLWEGYDNEGFIDSMNTT